MAHPDRQPTFGRPYRTSTLAPMAWSMFQFSPSPSRDEWALLFNRATNEAIDPAEDPHGLAETWRIAPKYGPCHDYAVTKREVMLHFGFHAGEMLLCECKLASGEYHMVLFASLSYGWVVFDNLTQEVVPRSEMKYEPVRWQSEDDPNYWFK
jgi:predicted transglutaminase-like cysteine proteinase